MWYRGEKEYVLKIGKSERNGLNKSKNIKGNVKEWLQTNIRYIAPRSMGEEGLLMGRKITC